MHQLMDTKRRSRNGRQADYPAHDRRPAARIGSIQVNVPAQQHKHRHQAHGKHTDYDHPPHEASVQEILIFKRMYVVNLIHSTLG